MNLFTRIKVKLWKKSNPNSKLDGTKLMMSGSRVRRTKISENQKSGRKSRRDQVPIIAVDAVNTLAMEKVSFNTESKKSTNIEEELCSDDCEVEELGILACLIKSKK